MHPDQINDPPMAHTIRETIPGQFVIVLPNGNFVRTTACETFMTADREKAEKALTFLTQDIGARRRGAHWLKSTFGVVA